MIYLRRTLVALMLVVQLFSAGVMVAPVRVFAAENTACAGSSPGFFGLPTWYRYLDYEFADNACNVSFNLREPRDYIAVGMAVFEILMRIAGLVALVAVMYGAFQFLTSQGEPDKFAAARTTILNALIGLAVAILAVTIVNLVGANI